jgi:hypothetical protein
MAKEIKLTQGKVAIVDDADFEYLNQWKWCARKDSKNGKFYAIRSTYIDGKCKTLLMHRVIVNNNDSKMHTDHCNGFTLDNRKINLRICTNSQNQMNKKTQINNKSGHKGVYFYKIANKWRSVIKINKVVYHLGYFLNKIDAAKAYNEAAIKYFGQFANLNIID